MLMFFLLIVLPTIENDLHFAHLIPILSRPLYLTGHDLTYRPFFSLSFLFIRSISLRIYLSLNPLVLCLICALPSEFVPST